MKFCSRCGQEKNISEFYKDKSRPDGFSYKCKKCADDINKNWKQKNPDTAKEAVARWFKNNPTKNREAVRRYKAAHKDMVEERAKKYRKEHPEKNRETSARYRRTLRGNLNKRMATRMGESLKGVKARRTWESLVGYTVDDLKKHLEKQFKDGMSWDNYGQWHIDHKIPVSAHNFTKAEDIDFQKCWSLKNLQPMWSRDNLKKKDKLSAPFQPSLLIGVQ